MARRKAASPYPFKDVRWPAEAIPQADVSRSVLDDWHQSAMGGLGSIRALRIAWCLEKLFSINLNGHAWPGDGYISQRTQMALADVQKGLLTLETDGAVVRHHHQQNGQRHRIIFMCDKIIKTYPPILEWGDKRQSGVLLPLQTEDSPHSNTEGHNNEIHMGSPNIVSLDEYIG